LDFRYALFYMYTTPRLLATNELSHNNKATLKDFAHLSRITAVFVTLIVFYPESVSAQTPSPLQEWQYSSGSILARLFGQESTEYRTILGLGSALLPEYGGARAYHVQAGPVVDIEYRDIAFASTGDGIGYNVFRGDHYRVGFALAYDLGRSEKSDLDNLHGMGSIGVAPVGKLFGSFVLSKQFPLILRWDVRQFAGGAQGAVGDAGLYLPLPGSSQTLVMFAGPSVTLATHHYLQTLYGVTPEQSLSSGHRPYEISTNDTCADGIGFGANKYLNEHWMLNLEAAVNQITGSASRSPLVERRTQHVLALSINYQL
jgi:outer membrane scaffolding protein for murein synthesis (MipA/OmpV family)